MEILEHKIFSSNRVLEVLAYGLSQKKNFDRSIFVDILGYIDRYIDHNGLEPYDAANIYLDFSREYNRHLSAFQETGKYPVELFQQGGRDWSREEYNIILLMSCLVAPHRYRIMQLLTERLTQGRKGIVVGCGPGLELSLAQGKVKVWEVYDLSFDSFVSVEHPSVKINQEIFAGQGELCDCVLLIEILEHVTEWEKLLTVTSKSVRTGGQIILTTATNIPQFDHVYNFPENHIDFEKILTSLGLVIEFSEHIPHHYMTSAVQASNRFYSLRKE